MGLGLGYMRGYVGCIIIICQLISLPFRLCGFGMVCRVIDFFLDNCSSGFFSSHHVGGGLTKNLFFHVLLVWLVPLDQVIPLSPKKKS